MAKQQQQSKTAPNTTEFKLKRPIEWGSETIDVFQLQEPTADDIGHLRKDPEMKDLVRVGLAMARQPYAMSKKMAAKDAIRLAEVVGDFLDDSPETGNIA